MKKWFLFVFLFIMWMFPDTVFAEEVHLYLFYGNTCPVCERERSYLQELVKSNHDVRLFEFETYDNIGNEVNMQTVKEMYHIRGEGVPFLVVGDIAIYGFGEATPSKIESAVKKQSSQDYYDRVGVYLGMFEDEETPKIPDGEMDDETSSFVVSSFEDTKSEPKNSFWKWTSLVVLFSILGVGVVVLGCFILSKKFKK